MVMIVLGIVGLLVLGVLVLVHELGHFAMAKLCRIRVLAFSIGFGKPLFTKTIGNTEYRLSAIPFGGYVHMAGEHPEDAHESTPDEYTSRPIWQRALVAIAGPAANVVFSILALWIMFVRGVPDTVYDSTVIGAVLDSSAASSAGLAAGDSVLSVNGVAVASWEELEREIATQGLQLEIKVIRGATQEDLHMRVPQGNRLEVGNTTALGILPPLPARVGKVFDDYPGFAAGIRKDDIVLALNGSPIHSWHHFSLLVKAYRASDGPLSIRIGRGDSVITLEVSPAYSEQEKRYLVGLEVAPPPTRTVRYGPVAALSPTINKAWEYTTMVFDVLRKLAKRKVSPSQLAGPIGIVSMTGVAALGGLQAILNFMALIGINLAVLNLFPLVITDGGVLLFLLLEALRRKPLSLKHQMLVNRIAISFFIALFLFVSFNDLLRIPLLVRLFSR